MEGQLPFSPILHTGTLATEQRTLGKGSMHHYSLINFAFDTWIAEIRTRVHFLMEGRQGSSKSLSQSGGGAG